MHTFTSTSMCIFIYILHYIILYHIVLYYIISYYIISYYNICIYLALYAHAGIPQLNPQIPTCVYWKDPDRGGGPVTIAAGAPVARINMGLPKIRVPVMRGPQNRGHNILGPPIWGNYQVGYFPQYLRDLAWRLKGSGRMVRNFVHME